MKDGAGVRERPTVDSATTSVFFDGAGAARMGDPAKTCNEPTDAPNGVVIASGSVLVGSRPAAASITLE